MEDSFMELLVSRKPSFKDHLVKILLVVLCLVNGFGALFLGTYFIIGLVAAVALTLYFYPRTSAEYEYLFVNGDIDIDIIYSRSRRKHIYSFSLKEIALAAPLSSHRMDGYRGNPSLVKRDFTSRECPSPMAVVTGGEKGREMILLENDRSFVDQMKKYAPSKVFSD